MRQPILLLLLLGGVLPAAMDVKKGSFTKSTCTPTCTQDIIDAGFQPKAYILWTTNQTAEGFAANQVFAMGWTDGTTSRSAAIHSQDNVSTTNAERRWATKVITIITTDGAGGTTLVAEADHSAFLSNGFRLSWTTNDSNGVLIHYIALGGTDITNAKVTAHTFSTGTGNQPYTGVGFLPDFLMLLSANHTAAATTTALSMSLGAGVSSSARWAISLGARDAINMTTTIDAGRYQRTDSIFSSVVNFAEDSRLDLVTMDSDGFTLNQVNAPAANLFSSLALKGGSYSVGAFAKCTTASCVNTITPSVAPKLVMISSFGANAATVVTANSAWSFGGFDSTSEGHGWAIQDDAVLNTEADCRFDTTKSVTKITSTPTAGPSAAEAEADGAISGNDFTLTWTTNDSGTTEICWASFGNGAPPPTAARRRVVTVD